MIVMAFPPTPERFRFRVNGNRNHSGEDSSVVKRWLQCASPNSFHRHHKRDLGILVWHILIHVLPPSYRAAATAPIW